jgi:hypothetical protein
MWRMMCRRVRRVSFTARKVGSLIDGIPVVGRPVGGEEEAKWEG